MADGLTIIVTNDWQRKRAMDLIAKAPPGTVLTFKPQTRTIPQNDRMWASLTDVALAKPEGRNHPTHVWKALAMDMAGCKPQWERSLDGQGVVCVGYKSSRLTKAEMSDVIEAIRAYAAEHGVELKDEAA